MELSRQEHWSGLAFPMPADLPEPGIKPMSRMPPAFGGRFFLTLCHLGSTLATLTTQTWKGGDNSSSVKQGLLRKMWWWRFFKTFLFTCKVSIFVTSNWEKTKPKQGLKGESFFYMEICNCILPRFTNLGIGCNSWSSFILPLSS